MVIPGNIEFVKNQPAHSPALPTVPPAQRHGKRKLTPAPSRGGRNTLPDELAGYVEKAPRCQMADSREHLSECSISEQAVSYTMPVQHARRRIVFSMYVMLWSNALSPMEIYSKSGEVCVRSPRLCRAH